MDKSLTPHGKTKNETEFHDTTEKTDHKRGTGFHRIAILFAETFIGQAVMMQFDKLLWTLEKTATWIPNGKTGKNTIKIISQHSYTHIKRKKNMILY